MPTKKELVKKAAFWLTGEVAELVINDLKIVDLETFEFLIVTFSGWVCFLIKFIPSLIFVVGYILFDFRHTPSIQVLLLEIGVFIGLYIGGALIDYPFEVQWETSGPKASFWVVMTWMWFVT